MGGEIVFYIWINCQCLKIIRFHCFSWKSWQLQACTPTWRPSAGSGGGCSCLQWHLLFMPHCLRHSWVFTLQSGPMSSVPGHLTPGPLPPVIYLESWLCNSRCGLGPQHGELLPPWLHTERQGPGVPCSAASSPFCCGTECLGESGPSQSPRTLGAAWRSWGVWGSNYFWTIVKEPRLGAEYPALNIKLETLALKLSLLSWADRDINRPRMRGWLSSGISCRSMWPISPGITTVPPIFFKKWLPKENAKWHIKDVKDN